MVLGDEIRSGQVLIKLLSNAVKFTPGGSMRVRAISSPSAGHLRFEIEDDRERFLKSFGADGYLEKPVIDSAVLIQRVQELINGTCK